MPQWKVPWTYDRFVITFRTPGQSFFNLFPGSYSNLNMHSALHISTLHSSTKQIPPEHTEKIIFFHILD